eukprot:CAMPEP_0180024350 /NCGR_PEP_ID=MMETSP0984-20121128/24042_1 /TAXON_ID=483367 /ORGANISM="non described non described, Strain CCMP 2436" /LENGTH=189 /DNA_ID=CAMNT_0021948843 /DNA_START=229 /DNA_END=794 /DNA_ORIENTATION=+
MVTTTVLLSRPASARVCASSVSFARGIGIAISKGRAAGVSVATCARSWPTVCVWLSLSTLRKPSAIRPQLDRGRGRAGVERGLARLNESGAAGCCVCPHGAALALEGEHAGGGRDVGLGALVDTVHVDVRAAGAGLELARHLPAVDICEKLRVLRVLRPAERTRVDREPVPPERDRVCLRRPGWRALGR